MVARRAHKGRSGLLVLALLLVLGGCRAPADDAALLWVEFLDQQRAALESDAFDAAAFIDRGEALVLELRTHYSPKDHKLPLTSAVLEEWQRAREEFRVAANAYEERTGDASATAAFLKLWQALAVQPPAGKAQSGDS